MEVVEVNPSVVTLHMNLDAPGARYPAVQMFWHRVSNPGSAKYYYPTFISYRHTVKRAMASCALEVFESWGSKQWPGPWRARGARAYNEGLGQSPQRGPGAEPLVGDQGAKPP